MAATLTSVRPSPRLGWLVALAAALLPGCVSWVPWIAYKETAPSGIVFEVHSNWEQRIVVTRDTENHGKPLAGLAGRIYLFGPNFGYPLRGNGKLDFEVYDVSKESAPVRVHGWSLDKDTLNNKLLRQDEAIGWGYTVFLPSENFKPDMTRVKINIRYVPEGGSPLYAPPATVNLHKDNAERPVVHSKTTIITPK